MTESDFVLDKRHIRDSFERAAATYDHAAVLQREVAENMLQRLDLVKHNPTRVLDIGSGTGYCAKRLTQRYRQARVIALDIAHAMLAHAKKHAGWFSHQRFICGDAEHLPVASDSIDFVVSNLTLQWCDPDRAFAEFLRVLRPGGLLMFTSFGPDTLRELRAAWARVDPLPHVHTFIDMHDLGDALIRAGFAEPVMDVSRFSLTYPDVATLLRDLKQLGAHNAAATRSQGLTGKKRFAQFTAAYETLRADGVIPATYEVVFGHAWAPVQKSNARPNNAGAVLIPLSQIQRRRR